MLKKEFREIPRGKNLSEQRESIHGDRVCETNQIQFLIFSDKSSLKLKIAHEKWKETSLLKWNTEVEN